MAQRLEQETRWQESPSLVLGTLSTKGRRKLYLLTWYGLNTTCSGPKLDHDFNHVEVTTHLFLSEIEALSNTADKWLAANPIFTSNWYWKTLPVGMETSLHPGSSDQG